MLLRSNGVALYLLPDAEALCGWLFAGGKILTGGSVIESEGNFVQPTIVEISPNAAVVKEELFAPVLYAMKFQVSLSG